MPAAVVRGILLSLGVLAALGFAVLENPEVQRWVEEQRRKIAELLRSIGEELDPQSRRAAEAFAFEGRTPNTSELLRGEVDAASNDTTAVATGRDDEGCEASSTLRRIPIQGTISSEQMQERQRLGKEYLERRNRQMTEMQEKRKAASNDTENETPSSPTSFDAMVDNEGNLKLSNIQSDSNVDNSIEPPQLAPTSSTSAGLAGLALGSYMANPFSDEYQMDRSDTPRPPVPPKIELDLEETQAHDAQQSHSLPPAPAPEPQPQPQPTFSQSRSVPRPDELSYEEQLAIALSLSEQEASGPSATVRRHSQEEHEAQFRAAIEASLRDMDHQQAAHAIHYSSSREPTVPSLLDLHSEDPVVKKPFRVLSFTPLSPTLQEDAVNSLLQRQESDEEDLYNVTPNLTRASLATLNAQQPPIALSTRFMDHPGLNEDAQSTQRPLAEASFYSAHEESSRARSTETLEGNEAVRHTSEDIQEQPQSGAQTPTTASSFAFHSDSDGSDTFASVSAIPLSTIPRSEISHTLPASSRAMSEASVEVIDVLEDSDDDDVMSVDGIATPDSWTEIGSRDGESEDERVQMIAQ